MPYSKFLFLLLRQEILPHYLSQRYLKPAVTLCDVSLEQGFLYHQQFITPIQCIDHILELWRQDGWWVWTRNRFLDWHRALLLFFGHQTQTPILNRKSRAHDLFLPNHCPMFLGFQFETPILIIIIMSKSWSLLNSSALDLFLDKDWLLESLLLYQSCKLVKFFYFQRCNLNQGIKREPNGSNRAKVRWLFGWDYFQPFDLVGLWIFIKIRTHIHMGFSVSKKIWQKPIIPLPLEIQNWNVGNRTGLRLGFRIRCKV